MAFVSRETRKQEMTSTVKEFFKQTSIGLIVIFIALGVMIAVNILNGQWQSALSTKAGDVNHLTAQVKQSRMKLDQTKTEARNLYTGVDVNRKATDDAIAEDVFKHATTWTGVAESQKVWSDIRVKYMSVQRPYYIGVFGVDTSADLERQKVLSCTYKNFMSYVMSVQNEVYYYRALVSYSQVLKDGTKVQKIFVTTYSIDNSGKFTGFTYDEVIK